MKSGKTLIASIMAAAVIVLATTPFGPLFAGSESVQSAGSSPLLSAPHILPPL